MDTDPQSAGSTDEGTWTRECPECAAHVEPEGRDTLACPRGHEFKRLEAFAAVGPDQTDAAAYVGEAMRGRLDDLATLQRVAGKDRQGLSAARMQALGLEPGAPHLDDQALQALDAYPLCVEATTTFEIVLGTGGPDDRLLVECDAGGNRRWDDRDHAPYEIRRILYRYSWSGSAERVLSGEDYDTAEALARRVVPELVE